MPNDNNAQFPQRNSFSANSIRETTVSSRICSALLCERGNCQWVAEIECEVHVWSMSHPLLLCTIPFFRIHSFISGFRFDQRMYTARSGSAYCIDLFISTQSITKHSRIFHRAHVLIISNITKPQVFAACISIRRGAFTVCVFLIVDSKARSYGLSDLCLCTKQARMFMHVCVCMYFFDRVIEVLQFYCRCFAFLPPFLLFRMRVKVEPFYRC